jgi:hypothetical protein
MLTTKLRSTPWLARRLRRTSYSKQDHSGILVFPFHHCCFSILTQVLTDSDNTSDIDKEALFDTMAGLLKKQYTCLDVDYGAISGQDQRWESIPGEEVRTGLPWPWLVAACACGKLITRFL